MKTELKKMIESLITESTEDATLHFHNYVIKKTDDTMNLTEMKAGRSRKFKNPIKLNNNFNIVGYGRDSNGNPIIRYEDQISGKRRTAQKSYKIRSITYDDLVNDDISKEIKDQLLDQAKDLFDN